MTAKSFLEGIQERQRANILLANSLKEIAIERLNKAANNKAWTPLQCVEHLAITNRTYLDHLGAIRPNIGPGKADAPFKKSFMGKVIVWMVGPNGKIMVPVPEAFEPTKGYKSLAVIERYLEDQVQMGQWLKEAQELNLNFKVSSPINDKFKFKFGEAFLILASHDERHLLQAKRGLA